MATALKPIGHDDRLTIIDHLDELRTRLIVCAITLTVAFGFCFWQNGALLDILNKPLKDSTPTVQHSAGNGRLAQVAAAQREVRAGLSAMASAVGTLKSASGLTAQQRAALAADASRIARAADALPKTNPPRLPITTGVGEPFTATLTVVAYFALLFSLPVILYEIYAFVLPAFSARERRVALPLMLMVPFLFAAGVAFGYELMLPPAISFLQNFNDRNFDVLIQARDYYRFAVLALLSTGLIFQMPVGLLALNSVGILSAQRLRSSWRYAIVGIAIVARAAAGRRSRHDLHRDGSAAAALRAQYPAVGDRRSAQGEPRGELESMLFDLQSRGRRTVVKFIYGGLAILLGGGLVLFGVGTGTGGNGLFDLFSNKGTNTSQQVSAAEKRADRAVKLNPNDAAAWATLARFRYQDAGFGDNYDQTQQTFTDAGVERAGRAVQAWDRYLALKPKKPDPSRPADVDRLLDRAQRRGEGGRHVRDRDDRAADRGELRAARPARLRRRAGPQGRPRGGQGDIARAKGPAQADQAVARDRRRPPSSSRSRERPARPARRRPPPAAPPAPTPSG